MESNRCPENDRDIQTSAQLSMFIDDLVENENPTSPPAPYVKILEQPAKTVRFRYECEGRSAGSIPGANSTTDNKTYPTIQVMHFVGRAVVVVSCVTKDYPYKPHSHNLVGKEGCEKGVCTLEINSDDMKIVFSNLGIKCVKKRDIEEALRVREEIRVDPFRTGYEKASIDINMVRLCFQVFLEGGQKGKFTTPLKPVVSDTICGKKTMSGLVITELSHCNAFCNGGQEMTLFCEKVAKEVHKQVARLFRTPKYRAIDISEPVRVKNQGVDAHQEKSSSIKALVKIQLQRPSDGATSDPLDFEMLPLDEGRRSFWNIHRELKKRSATTDLFQQLLEEHDSENKFKVQNVERVDSLPLHMHNDVVLLDTPVEETAKPIVVTITTTRRFIGLRMPNLSLRFEGNIENNQNIINQSEDDKALSDLLEQVAELDVIYK